MTTMPRLPDFEHSLFLEGPAGSGKTTAACQYLSDLISQQRVPPDQILILVPHLTLANPYRQALSTLQLQGTPEITTLSGLARLAVRAFWSLVVGQQGLKPDLAEPRFLSADLAQYHLHRFVQPYWEMGIFTSIRLPKYRVVTQILDSINNAALASLSFDEVAARLVAAWGARHSSRVAIYETTLEIARQYHNFCLEQGLLDFALQLSLLVNSLLDEPVFQSSFSQQFRYCMVDNVEEMGALAHDFVFWCLEHVEKTLVIYDRDGGYRAFLGADPANAYLLRDVCVSRFVLDTPVALTPSMRQLVNTTQSIGTTDTPPTLTTASPGIMVSTSMFYPQMVDHCVQQVQRLVEDGVSPDQIALITPYLNDALLFALQSRLQTLNIPTVYYRPSRPLRNEPSVQMLITLMQLTGASVPQPTALAVMHALCQAITGLDPVRGALLTQAVYRPTSSPRLEPLSPAMPERLPAAVCQTYKQLQQWLSSHAIEARYHPEQFLDTLVYHLLTQPGFVYHGAATPPAVIVEVLNTVLRFSGMYISSENTDNVPVLDEFLRFLMDGFTAAAQDLTLPSAVLITPAHTFLTRNLTVDYQFWLDAGDNGWYERIEQPLTHAYVLRRGFPAGTEWSDDMELAAQTDSLRRIILGLLRRCRQGVFIEACDISATGYEQRGQLLLALQPVFAATFGAAL